MLGAVALLAAVPFRIARLGGGLDALRDDDVLMVGAARSDRYLHRGHGQRPARRRRARRPSRRAVAGAGAFAVVALAGFAIEGHTRATGRRWVMIASDVVHLAAGAVWLGGIVALVVAFRVDVDTGALAGVVRRFSTSAIVAVVVVAVTGVTMAWIILPSVGELTSTGYGLALLLKVALVARRHRPRGVQPLPPGACRRGRATGPARHAGSPRRQPAGGSATSSAPSSCCSSPSSASPR